MNNWVLFQGNNWVLFQGNNWVLFQGNNWVLFQGNNWVLFQGKRVWSGGAKVPGKLPVPGRPTYLGCRRARA